MRHITSARHVLGATAFALVTGTAACGSPDAGMPDPGLEETAATAPSAAEPITVEDVGFDTPESAQHDATADVYLVSNIGGDPAAKDNNGFISRVSPDGAVIELRWIAGGTGDVVLHAPKGIALKGDSLFVTDIDSLRIFHRENGTPLGARGVEGATFLNDPAVGPDGTLYVTDSGLQGGAQGLEPSGTDAVIRFEADGTATRLASGTDLQNPNGIAVDGEGVIVVPFGGNEIYRLDAAGERSPVAQLPGGQLDGVIQLTDGSLLASSWEGQAVYRVDAAGSVTTVAENISSPADIGLDAARNRVLIPVFTENRLLIVPLQ